MISRNTNDECRGDAAEYLTALANYPAAGVNIRHASELSHMGEHEMIFTPTFYNLFTK